MVSLVYLQDLSFYSKPCQLKRTWSQQARYCPCHIQYNPDFNICNVITPVPLLISVFWVSFLATKLDMNLDILSINVGLWELKAEKL